MQKPRRKKCKTCGALFVPWNSLTVVCSSVCAIEFGKSKAGNDHRKRLERKETREARKRIKSKAQWRKEAQAAFNAYIRARDSGLPCISCNRHHTGQWHAGHYRSVGAAPESRFDEDNCHAQCAPCNTHLSGNLVMYRVNLIQKIGLERVEELEKEGEPKKYTVDDLKKIKAKYKAMAKALNNETD